MNENPKRIFLISPVLFDNEEEAERNLFITERVIESLQDFGFEVMDVISLLKEANKKKNNLIVGMNNKKISDHSWANFCLFRYLCANMAFCDYVAIAGDIDECLIAGSLYLNSLLMQMPVVVPVSNLDGVSIKVEAVAEMRLPYINYKNIRPKINGSTRDDNKNRVDIENSGNIPPIDRDLGNWFDSQFKNKGEKP